MSMMRRFILPAFVVLLALVGCRQADRVTSVPPTRAELPSSEKLELKLAVRVGVEGGPVAPRVIFVPKFEEIELTPEEREALGEEKEPQPDILAFYRPPRGAEHGVTSEEFGMLVGIHGAGGALVGRASVYPRFGTYGFAGRYYSQSLLDRPGESVGRARLRITEVGRPWTLSVGENRPRRPARRESRLER